MAISVSGPAVIDAAVRRRPSEPLAAYFGHHRCGSTWIHAILEGICANAGWRLAYLPDEDWLGPFQGDLGVFVDRRSVEFLSFVNANIEFVGKLGSFRGFHVVRDPRDMLVSAYYSHLHSHSTEHWPQLVDHRKELQRLSEHEGLLSEMEFSRKYFEHMTRWDYNQDNVLELRLEDIAADPYGHFLRIFGFLGIVGEEPFSKKRQLAFWWRSSLNILWRHRLMPWRSRSRTFPAERLLGIVHHHRFARMAHGRRRGQEDVKSHYRKGISGDWANHFGAEHVARFKASYGDLLIKLGYEDTPDWSPRDRLVPDAREAPASRGR